MSFVPSVDPSTIDTVHHDVLALIVSLLSDIDMQVIKDKIIYTEAHIPLAEYGYLNLLKLYDGLCGQYSNYSNICSHAAKNGHINILQWIEDNICKVGAVIYAYANDNLEVLQWAFDNGYKFDGGFCQNAVICGYIDALKWAKSNGYILNSYLCGVAIIHGQLTSLQWLLTNGCVWNEYMRETTINFGHPHIKQWAKDNELI